MNIFKTPWTFSKTHWTFQNLQDKHLTPGNRIESELGGWYVLEGDFIAELARLVNYTTMDLPNIFHFIVEL